MLDRNSTTTTVPRFRLIVPAGDPSGFDMWHWAVSPMFDIDAGDAESRSAFSMDASGYHFADIAITSSTSSATRFTRSRSVIARSGIENFLVQFYHATPYQLDIEGRQTRIEPGDIVVTDLSRPSTIVTEAYTNTGLILPRAMLAPLVARIDSLHGMVLRRGAPLHALLMSHLQMLNAQAPSLTIGDGPSVAQGTAALVAACVGPAAVASETAAHSVSVASLQMLRRVVDEHLAEPALDADFLIGIARMSRASLYRLFEPLGGVQRYILQRRLTRTYRDISSPALFHERISTIARRWGFVNDANFSRVFRDAYGMSPSDLRETAHTGYREAHQARRGDDGSFWAVNRWLLGMDAFRR